MQYTERFKRVLKIVNLSATNTAQSVAVGGLNCSVVLGTGNLFVDPTGTATVNSIKVPANYPINLNVKGDLSYISDSTATGQVIIYED